MKKPKVAFRRAIKLIELMNKGIIFKSIDLISEKNIFVVTCQKCDEKWKLKNIKKLPKTCIKCKRDPYKGPGKRGRPKK